MEVDAAPAHMVCHSAFAVMGLGRYAEDGWQRAGGNGLRERWNGVGGWR